jgi:hypothetical protein
MSAEDRESKFERALAQQLRAGSPHAGCPDAETLAAYHERLLSLEEMGSWKQHIAGCAACQETLALVEVTEEQLAEDWEEQPIPVIEAATKTVSAKSDLGRVAAPSVVGKTPVSITQKRRPVLIRWAIPLGAVAAGVLVWIGIHEQEALHNAVPPESVQVAKNLPAMPPAVSQDAAAPRPAVPAERDREASRLDSQLAQNAAAPPIVPMAKSQTEQRTDDFVAGGTLRKDAVLAKKIPAPATPAARGMGAAAVADALPAAPPPPAPSPKQEASRTVTETVEVTSEAAPVSSTGKQPVDLPGGQGNGNTVQDQKRVAAMSNSKSAQQFSDAATDAMMMSQGINGRSVNSLQLEATGTAVVRTPDNKVWWKLGNTGTVELTTDAGKKWKAMDTSAGAQLTNGSAPSSKVCWIAGHAGTLVLTTDRGNHWKKLATPVTGDLGGVHAADAKHATVWDTANRLSYQTSDGGVTWKQTANE